MRPKVPRSSVLTAEEEAVAAALRRSTLLPLGDCLYALQASTPHLSRSSLHRLLQRHDISRLPTIEGDKVERKTLKAYPIGYFHTDIVEVWTEQGKLVMLVAIDRTSKFAFAELRISRRTAADLLRRLIEAVPLTAHTVLTDNGTHFTSPRHKRSAAAEIRLPIKTGEIFRAQAFELTYAQLGIDHRLTKPCHSWTNGQVERMNRTIKEATVRSYHDESHDQLRDHLAALVAAHNFAKRLKTRCGLTPLQAIHNCLDRRTQPLQAIARPPHIGTEQLVSREPVFREEDHYQSDIAGGGGRSYPRRHRPVRPRTAGTVFKRMKK
jgi:transposase InsO family protein